MQAVILAAGESTRTRPLTISRPKPLLRILDRTILDHNLDQLVGLVHEVVIVVGFKKEMILERYEDVYKGMRLIYVEQEERLGTAHALQAARPYLGDRFLVLNADDLFAAKDLQALAKHDSGILVAEVDDMSRFGAVILEAGRVAAIVEKPAEPVSRLANTGAYALTHEVFETELGRGVRGEYEMPDYVNALAASHRVEHEVVRDYWLALTYPWNYLEANAAMLRRLPRSHIDETAVIEDGVTMKGVVVVGPYSEIRSGSYIEGPVFIGHRCEVGPGAYLRPDTVLMDGVRTRAEIVDSVLMANTTAKHTCYIGHSVIGEGCNIAAGTITADYRHDELTNWSMILGQRVDSRRRKLGAFIGDNVRTGIGTMIYPGRKIWPGCTTLPGAVVTEDVLG